MMTQSKLIFSLALGFCLIGSCPVPAQNSPEIFPCVWPCNGFITAYFGQQEGIIGDQVAINQGIDIEAKAGTKVNSTAAGTVLSAERYGPAGYMVILTHNNGYISRYSSLETLSVKPGDQVTTMQPLGTLGPGTLKDNYATLHFEVYYQGVPQDPMKLISPPLQK